MAGVALVAATALVAGQAGVAQAAPAPTLANAILPVPAPLEQRTPQTMTADALPTVQINNGGIVWAQTVVGDIVYVGGSFTAARPAGAANGVNTTPRTNLLAYNIKTGQLVPDWAPTTNGTVKSITASPDGTRIYVGGSFSQANGTTRWNIAAFDTATGALSNTFRPAVGGSYVNAIVATNTAVYVGGLVSAGAGVARKNLMAFTTSGQLTGWAPSTDLQVDAMVRAPGTDKLIVGGRFAIVNDVSQRGLVALSLTDGSIQPWTAPSIIKNGSNVGANSGKAGIYSLNVDDTNVFGTGWVYASWDIGNLEGVFSAQAQSGDLNWVADCHGDHYGAYSDGQYVYSVSHEHSCETMGGFPQKDPAPGNMRNATATTAEAKGTLGTNTNGHYANWAGTPAPAPVNWYPDWYTGTASGQGQAGWTVVGTGDYMSVGGEFIGVNGQAQYGLVRFARGTVAPKNQGPRLSGTGWVPSGGSVRSTQIRVSVPVNWDRDDRDLTYRLVRTGVATPVDSVSRSATFWESGRVVLNDNTVQPGQTYTYRVQAVDADGNVANSDSISVTASSASLSAYGNRVLDDDPSLYWRLGGGAGPVADVIGANPGTASNGVTPGATGAISGDSDKGSTFNGTTAGLAATNARVPAATEFTMEAWFSTTTNQGGKLAGYGISASGSSSNYDRHLYMRNDGRVNFGTYSGTTNVLTSPNPLNNGAWHHVVATQSTSGMRLYIDGALVGQNSASTAENYLGYWRLGGDNLNGWPNQPNSQWFAGSIDEFAIYDRALGAATVASHYDLGVGNFPPTAAFTSSASALTASLDASTSTAAAGRTITAYSWNFGDGSVAGTGVTTDHIYASPGTYSVTLTVTDNTGKTGTITKDVVVKAPHAAPVAVIAAPSINGLTVGFDGSGSTASDGESISAYEWTFGDGATATTATPTRKYAVAGSYTVTLRVRDTTGAWSAPVERGVEVTHADPSASFTVAKDQLAVSVDASASSAADGATLSYNWAWGDGTPAGSGRTANHTYAVDGNYTITLTLTDSLGGTATTTREVSVAAPTSYVSDDFGRTIASGWGSAGVGGSWSGTAGLSVSGGAGVATINKSITRNVSLDGVNVADSDSRFTVASDKVADGGGVHINYSVHRSSAGLYRVKLRIAADGVVNVGLAKLVGTTETLMANRVLTGYTYTADSVLNVRLQSVTSGGTTTLRTKVWQVGSSEPTAWYVTTTDGTADLQGPGGVGFSMYGTGTVTNGPVRILVDDLDVR